MSIEVKISKRRISYKTAIKILNKRVELLKLKKGKELLWILEHPLTFTAGIRSDDTEILDKKIKIIKTNRGGKITLHNPGQKIIYIVLDFKNITPSDFNISKFIDYCSLNGKIKFNGIYHTLLLSPMGGFYNEKSKGDKQARIALVEQESKMKIVPKILSRLLANYLKLAKV